MRTKNIIIITITIIICILIITTALIYIENNKNTQENNTTNSNNTTLNNSNTTQNNNVTYDKKSKHYEYGEVINSYKDSNGHLIVERYGTGDDTPGSYTIDETTGEFIDEEIWV